MDLRAQHLSETCSDPIEFLNHLRQTTEPIGGGTVYSEDGELVEYDVAIEAVGKANDAFIENAVEWLMEHKEVVETEDNGIMGWIPDYFIDDFKKYMKGE